MQVRLLRFSTRSLAPVAFCALCFAERLYCLSGGFNERVREFVWTLAVPLAAPLTVAEVREEAINMSRLRRFVFGIPSMSPYGRACILGVEFPTPRVLQGYLDLSLCTVIDLFLCAWWC